MGSEMCIRDRDGSKYTIKELEETGIIEDVTELVNKGEIVIE